MLNLRSLLNGMRNATLWVFLGGWLICSWNIGGLSIYILDEAKNTTCAKEMYERGDGVVPTFNGELRTDKPPLHYFFMMAAFRLWGINEFAARFFSGAMGGLILAAVFYFVRLYINEKAAWFSVISLAASLHFLLQFHLAVPDPYLVACLTLGLLLFYSCWKDFSLPACMGMYAAFALGVLAKGPVAIAIPGLIVLLFLLVRGELNLNRIFSFRPIWGLLLMLLIAAPWYVWVHIRTEGAWTRGFFLDHNVNRFTQTMEGHGGIFLLPVIYVLAGLLPFSIFLIQGLVAAWKKRREHPFLLFSGLCVACFTGFFMFSSTKLPNYTVPAYPFAAILMGFYLHEKRHNLPFWPLMVHLLIALALPIGAWYALGADKVLYQVQDLAFWMVIPALGAILALFLRKKPAAIYALFASWVMFSLVFFSILFPAVDRLTPVQRSLMYLENAGPVAQYRIVNRAYHFYVGKTIPVLEQPREVEDFFRKYPEGRLILRGADLKALQPLPEGVDTLVFLPDVFEKHQSAIVGRKK